MKKTTYVLHVPAGLCPDDFEKKKNLLEHAFNGRITYGYNGGQVIMTVAEDLGADYPYLFKQTKNPLEIYMGESFKGEFWLDIEKSQHIILGGATDSGKSSGLLTIALSLILSSHKVDLHIHDFQDMTFGMFQGCKKVKSYGTTPTEFEVLLDEMEQESKRRLNLFKSVRDKIYIEKLSVWNKEFPERAMPYKVVLVDELGTISTDEFKPLFDKFRVRVQVDRKAGIHYIIVIHRCSVDMLSGSIKNNMPTRIAFRCASETDSRVILDEAGAENLKAQGRFLIMNYNGLQEVQALYIQPKKIEQILKEHSTYKSRAEIEAAEKLLREAVETKIRKLAEEQAEQEKQEIEQTRKRMIEYFHKFNKNPYKKGDKNENKA